MNNTGGPAFPNEGFNGWGEPQQGMSLRDFFAAKILPRCLEFCSTNSKAAEEAYRIADAMLEAREQK